MTVRTKPRGKHGVADCRLAFAVRYLANGGDATEAATHAGYSPRTAHAQGSRLLKDPDVAALVEAKRAKAVARLEERHDLTLDRVLEELRLVGFARLTDVATWDDGGRVSLLSSDELDERGSAGLFSLEVTSQQRRNDPDVTVTKQKVKMHPKVAALSDLRAFLTPSDQAVAKVLEDVRGRIASTLRILYDELPEDEARRVEGRLKLVWGAKSPDAAHEAPNEAPAA